MVTLCSTWGCTQTYVFHPNQVPPIKDGDMIMKIVEAPHSPSAAFPIIHMGVRRHSDPSRIAWPSVTEMDAIGAGDVQGLQVVEVTVDTTAKLWRDHGLVWGGAAVSTVLGVGQLNDFDGINFIVASLVAVVVGVEMTLLGTLQAAIFAPDVVVVSYGSPRDY